MQDMKVFWLEDIEDNEYNSSIAAIVCEFLMSNDNKEQLRNVIFDYIRKVLGIKVNYDNYEKIIDENEHFEKEPTDVDIIVKLKEESVQKFRERYDKYSIDNYIVKFCEKTGCQGQEESIKNVLLKSLYININSFAVAVYQIVFAIKNHLQISLCKWLIIKWAILDSN